MGFEWELFRDGLYVMGTGMGIVFLVLLLLMGVILAAGRLDALTARWGSGRRPEAGPSSQQPEADVPGAGPSISNEVVAAITVALQFALQGSPSSGVSGSSAGRGRGPAPTGASPSPWVLSGRRRALESSLRLSR